MLKNAHHSFWLLVFLSSLFIVKACKEEIVPQEYAPTDAHDAYIWGLEKAGLDKSVLARNWIEASQSALSNPLEIETPYEEEFYVADEEVIGSGYLFFVRRGQRVDIQAQIQASDSIQIFMDVFRVDSSRQPMLNKVASSYQNKISFEPRTDANYVFRFQNELLSSGRFSIDIAVSPSMAFPVKGGDRRDIGSFFGDPRDGGRRKHHGVDIFARRHTPILAPVPGRIRWTGERGLGGRVVWMRDEQRQQTIYFAHLEDILTTAGERVQIGDTIGTVGNTGNARTTPPHLHFGIYKDGPVDPYHFIVPDKRKVPRIRGDQDLLNTIVRCKSPVKAHGPRGEELLNKDQIMKIAGRTGSFFRVLLPDNTAYFVEHQLVEPVEESLFERKIEPGIHVRANPSEEAITVDAVDETQEVKILGLSNEFAFVLLANGTRGWIPRVVI